MELLELAESQELLISYDSLSELKNIQLLFEARNIPYQQKGLGTLVVSGEFTLKARYELQIFKEENINWPPVAGKNSSEFKVSFIQLLIILLLVCFHRKTSLFTPGIDWVKQGVMSAELVLSGDFYRTVTSLTLHADDAHLLSNVVGLGLFWGALNKQLGAGVSFLLTLVSGALGNYLNAAFYSLNHNSLGASTAVFACVGILASLSIKNCFLENRSFSKLIIPFGSSVGIFAILGTSLETDVAAHLFGFLSGFCVSGLFLFFFQLKQADNYLLQLVSFFFSLTLIFYSWKLAFMDSQATFWFMLDFW